MVGESRSPSVSSHGAAAGRGAMEPPGGPSRPYLAVCPPAPPHHRPRFAASPPPLPALPRAGPPYVAWAGGAGALEHERALVAGATCDGAPLLLGRALFDVGLLPARVDRRGWAALAAWGGAELAAHLPHFEVLLLARGRAEWVAACDGDAPAHALPVCPMPSGETAFAARASYGGALVPGRLVESEGGCVITHEGRELTFREYEVLVVL